ncbi:WXG100 family type VII secretion target [Kitasatospora sp. NPDC092948]|uniref:WXG100 family type VII secretion target n=1 Tax=Kitasatospora sp. NPDC092948 TaxID=3364088 RepID=UPI0037FF632F
MAGDGVNIDLDEVQAAAKTIAALLEELQGPYAQLEAHINMVTDKVYGTDLLGKSLTGDTSSVGGFNQHQKDVLAGIKLLLSNATTMGANLQTMAARHQANDEHHASELSRITTGDGTPIGPSTPSTPSTAPGPDPSTAPEPAPAPAPTPEPAPAPAPTPQPDTGGYHTQTGPDLDYNKPKPPPEPHGPVGGGPGRNLI